jgi:hypothetical protein
VSFRVLVDEADEEEDKEGVEEEAWLSMSISTSIPIVSKCWSSSRTNGGRESLGGTKERGASESAKLEDPNEVNVEKSSALGLCPWPPSLSPYPSSSSPSSSELLIFHELESDVIMRPVFRKQ